MAKPRVIIPPLDRIADDTPLRLDVAAKIAFPDGTMSGNGLRSEARHGHLEIRRIAGRYYTTLQAIQEMFKACPRGDEDRDCGPDRNDRTPQDASSMPATGSLSTADIKKAHDAALTIVEELSTRSRNTSRASSFGKQPKARVIQLRSRLPRS